MYTIAQTAEMLQMARKTVSAVIANGELKAARLANGTRVKGAWIDELVNDRLMIGKGRAPENENKEEARR